MKKYFYIYAVTVIILVILGIINSLDSFFNFNFLLISFIIYIHLPKPTKAQIRSRNAAQKREWNKEQVLNRKRQREDKKREKELALEIYRANKPYRNKCGYGLSTSKRFNDYY